MDQLRPHSRGAVRLRSADPSATPAVTFNYLSDARDVAELVEGYRTAQELLAQPAFDVFRGDMVLGVPPATAGSLKGVSDSEIEAWVRRSSGTDYHPCGTCRMGSDDDADERIVVDGKLRVRDMRGLYVVDASVMPAIVSGNLNAPTQMIAMKAADIILGKPLMQPERPRFHFDGATSGSC